MPHPGLPKPGYNQPKPGYPPRNAPYFPHWDFPKPKKQGK